MELNELNASEIEVPLQPLPSKKLVATSSGNGNVKRIGVFYFFMHFCPGTITTHAELINSDLQRGLDRRLRHIQH